VATEIGIIKTLIGTAVATAADGSQRNLQAGDRVYQDEIITTGAAGAVEVEFTDGSVMTLGRSSQIVLDTETFNPLDVAQAPADAASEVEALQQALLDGADPTQVGDATAAGAGTTAGGNEGTDFVTVDYLAPEVTPTSGFDTTGIAVEFPEIEEEVPGPEEDLPTISVSVEVEVEIEIDPENPPETEPPTDGIPTPDYPVLVSGNAASVLEGTGDVQTEDGTEASTKEVTFILSLDKVFDQDVDVTYELRPVSTDGTADNPTDWFDGASPQTVTIPAGTTTFPVTVNIVEDHLDEGNGTFEIVILNATNATVNPDADSAVVTIFDDDTTPDANPDTNFVQATPIQEPYEEFDGEVRILQQSEPEPASTAGNVLTDASYEYNPTPGEDEDGDEVAFNDVADTDEDGDSLEVTGVVAHGLDGALGGGDDTVGTIGSPVNGQYGELTLRADGSYDYVAGPQTSELTFGESVQDQFTYTVTDTYNQPQTTTLTITIFGGDSGVSISGEIDLLVDEDGLAGAVVDAGRTGEVDSTESTTDNGSFTIDAQDGVASLTIGGNLIISNDVLVANPFTTSLGNTFTVTGYDSDTGIVSYTYDLNPNGVTHAADDAEDTVSEQFSVVLKDTDGDETSAEITAEVVDDIPTAAITTDLDFVQDLVDGEPTGTGNLTASGTATVGATVTIAGGFSTTADGSGNWSIDLGAANEADAPYSVTATATVTDGDGDIAVATDDGSDTLPTAAITTDLDFVQDLVDGEPTGTGNLTASGTATVGATVTIAGGFSTTADGSGNWSIDLGAANEADAPYSVTATATVTDGDGDIAVATDDGSDTLPTAAITTDLDFVQDLVDGEPTGTGNLTASGTATVGATVTIAGGFSTTADGSGNWSIDLGAANEADAPYSVTATATVTDGDGDIAVATDDGSDTLPTASSTSSIVDETGGLDSVDGTLSGTGTISLSATGATWTAGTNTLQANDNSWKVVNNGSGTYTFTQLLVMTHSGADDAAITLNINVLATDTDNDVASSSFTVTVYDDGPVATDYDGTILHSDSSLDGILDYNLGQDGLGGVTFSLASSSIPLTSGGKAITTTSVDTDGDGLENLVGYVDLDSSGTYDAGEEVFTIAPTTDDAVDGTYDFALSGTNVLDLPSTPIELSFSGIAAGAPVESIDVGSELTISFVDAGTLVNASNGFIGIDNNIMNDNGGGETILYTFNSTLVNNLQFDIKDVGGSGDTLEWTSFNSVDNTTDNGTLTINGNGLSDPVVSGIDFDSIEFHITSGDFKVGGITYTDEGDPSDVLMTFDYQAAGGDGDSVNGSIDITVSPTTSTGLGDDDILSSPDSADVS
jgi:large repetitive protein